MRYYVGIIVRHGFQFYLSNKQPFSNKNAGEGKWFAYIGPQTAFRFINKDDAAARKACLDAVNTYCKGKTDILGGIAEVQFFKPKS